MQEEGTMRNVRAFAAAMLFAAMPGFGITEAAAQAYPIIGEPVLNEDSQFEATDWGYKAKDLDLAAEAGKNWPTAFTMEGYDGASRPAPNAYLRMDDGELMALKITFGQGPRGDYAFVQASTRGTECSGGHFNLYDDRHARDAHHIINWIAEEQDWSNGKVGMFGSSFPGQTAYWAAAKDKSERPRGLKAVSANLLHSDIYRDIFMPGGVQNILFPTVWTYGMGVSGPHRIPLTSLEEGTIPADEICTQAQLTRYGVGDLFHAENEPIWAGTKAVDDDWYRAHAALTYAGLVDLPFYLQDNWQDEQVGPRSVVLWHHINPDPVTIARDHDGNGETPCVEQTIVPKKFVLSSGDHGHGGYAGRDRWDLFDIFLLGRCDENGLFDDAVVNTFEADGDGVGVATKSGDQWPFAGTDWQRWYMHQGGLLDRNPQTGAEAADTYVSGIPRPGFFTETGNLGQELTMADGPDDVVYRTEPLGADLVVAGPILIDLYAALVGTDADFFVALYDVWPDGRMSYVQRGMLKASHRDVDPLRSYYVLDDANGQRVYNGTGANYDGDIADLLMVQPYRPHTNPQPRIPGETEQYRIEIFPLGHVFRAGHRIMVRVMTPPLTDSLWGYTATHHQPALVTLSHDAEHPAFLQLPVVQPDGPVADGECQIPAGFPCFDPSPLSLEQP
jgi:hypothetical protein